MKFLLILLLPVFGYSQGNNKPCSAGCTTCNPHFECISCICTTPVPVELLYFKAEKVDGNTLLTWSTASEYNNSHFDIEKVVTGSFYCVGRVDGSGNSSMTKNYQFTDTVPGKNYYRLKQVDYNGEFEYSSIIYLDTFISKTVTVYNMLGQIIYKGEPKSYYGPGFYKIISNI